MTFANDSPQRLGNVLLERGYLTLNDLETALLSQRQKSGSHGKLLGEILVDLNLCSEDQVVECLAAEYGVPYAKLEPRICTIPRQSSCCRGIISNKTWCCRCSSCAARSPWRCRSPRTCS